MEQSSGVNEITYSSGSEGKGTVNVPEPLIGRAICVRKCEEEIFLEAQRI